VLREDPTFQPNRDFPRDAMNIVVGIIWQVTLVALPIYLVIKRFDAAAIAIAVIAVTSIILKFTWYDHLRKMELESPAARM
jgi:solute:Na+ symporter, SSS family